jgi:EVE domain-containing protein
VANYILVTADGKSSTGTIIRAPAVAAARLKSHSWPIYQRTKYRTEFAIGDRLVIYVGGKTRGGQVFVATTKIVGITPADSAVERLEGALRSKGRIALWLDLDAPAALQPPVQVKSLLSRLSFTSDKSAHWGVAFAGGVRRIPEEDWKLIAGR